MLERSVPLPLCGLWHLALRVRDLAKSRVFYQDLLGMKVVWEPDPENLYLSLGQDNLALHQIPKEATLAPGPLQALDHLGFIVPSQDAVDSIASAMEQAGVVIVTPIRLHRDGSYSFYMEDPDHNRVQILYEPRMVVSQIPR